MGSSGLGVPYGAGYMWGVVCHHELTNFNGLHGRGVVSYPGCL